MQTIPPSQSGMSLVEVMLASALGLFLIFGFIQLYLSVQKTFYLQQAVVGIQENARFAVHFLHESIRMAGHAQCDAGDDFVNPALAIQGYGNVLPDFLKGRVKQDTDSVVVGECVLEDKKFKFQRFAFFVGHTDRKNKLGKTIDALYEKPEDGYKRELVSGVEDMSIRYGVVDDADDKKIADYLMQSQVLDWKKVRAVQIALLLSSEQPVLAKPEPYTFAGKEFTADRFLHREWDVYVALRELGL